MTHFLQIDNEKVRKLTTFLIEHCEGPEEAFAVLCAAIYDLGKYNAKITDTKVTATEIAAETSSAIMSLEGTMQ